ncbi:MAG TPA: hypothetical protein VF158_13445 [Longimicrobiales bacterium]
MARYRVTIRFEDSGKRYEMLDVEAPSLREALRRAADEFPSEAEGTADLAEIRLQVEPEARPYTPG